MCYIYQEKLAKLQEEVETKKMAVGDAERGNTVKLSYSNPCPK
jgi:hypothetical protein